MTEKDWEKIKNTYNSILALKEDGVAKLNVKLENGGSALVYSMGATNPVIRIDIKEEKK